MRERDLQMKYQEMCSQIERLHSLQMTARFVGSQGTLQFIFGAYLLAYSLISEGEELSPKIESKLKLI